MLIESTGHQVTNALGFGQAKTHCVAGGFDLFILGHSIPKKDKLELIKLFRANCPAPILSLERNGEDFVPCDFHVSADDPEKFVQVVDNILAGDKLGVPRKYNV